MWARTSSITVFFHWYFPLLVFVFCSRVVSSYGKTAEWPFGSSFQPPVSLALVPRADAIQRQPPTSSGKGLGAGGSWLWEVSGGAAGFAGLG